MTPIGLAVRLGIEQEAAAELIEQYFVAYLKVKEYLDGNAIRATRTGKLTTPIGRIRRFGDVSAMSRRERNEVGRQAKNFPPDPGACADGLKLALALLWERRDECPEAIPILAVHDEIVVEVKDDKAAATQAWLKERWLREWRGRSTIPSLEVATAMKRDDDPKPEPSIPLRHPLLFRRFAVPLGFEELVLFRVLVVQAATPHSSADVGRPSSSTDVGRPSQGLQQQVTQFSSPPSPLSPQIRGTPCVLHHRHTPNRTCLCPQHRSRPPP
jgi:hypothetical protein